MRPRLTRPFAVRQLGARILGHMLLLASNCFVAYCGVLQASAVGCPCHSRNCSSPPSPFFVLSVSRLTPSLWPLLAGADSAVFAAEVSAGREEARCAGLEGGVAAGRAVGTDDCPFLLLLTNDVALCRWRILPGCRCPTTRGCGATCPGTCTAWCTWMSPRRQSGTPRHCRRRCAAMRSATVLVCCPVAHHFVTLCSFKRRYVAAVSARARCSLKERRRRRRGQPGSSHSSVARPPLRQTSPAWLSSHQAKRIWGRHVAAHAAAVAPGWPSRRRARGDCVGVTGAQGENSAARSRTTAHR